MEIASICASTTIYLLKFLKFKFPTQLFLLNFISLSYIKLFHISNWMSLRAIQTESVQNLPTKCFHPLISPNSRSTPCFLSIGFPLLSQSWETRPIVLFANSFPRHKTLANGPLALNPAQRSPSLWCTPFITHLYSFAWTSLPIICLENVTNVHTGSLTAFLVSLKCASLNGRSLKSKSYFSQSTLYPGFHTWPNFHQEDQCTWHVVRESEHWFGGHDSFPFGRQAQMWKSWNFSFLLWL